MSKQLALVAEGKRLGLIVVLAALLAALAAVGAPMWTTGAHAASADLCPGIYHVNPDGTLDTGDLGTGTNPTTEESCTPADDNGPNGSTLVANNVIGYTHEVCAINTGDLEGFQTVGDTDGANPSDTSFGPNNNGGFTYYFVVQPQGSGPAAVQGTILGAGNEGLADSVFGEGGSFNNPDAGIVCATWTATGPGDQFVTLNASHTNNVVAGTAGGPDCSAVGLDSAPLEVTACDPVIKEWNVLSPTTITATAVNTVPSSSNVYPKTSDQSTAAGNLDQGNPTSPAVVGPNGSAQTATLTFNPADSAYTGSSKVYYENVWGTHTPNQGAAQWYLVAGAQVTFTNTSSGVGACGVLAVGDDVNGTTTFLNPTSSNGAYANTPVSYVEPGESVTVTSVGVSIPFHFFSFSASYPNDSCTQTLGSQSSVSISVGYPSAVGSTQPTLPAETLQVKWTTPPAAVKQVLLAWAGQTVILEHDWRIQPGDSSDLDPAGFCAFWDTTGDAYIQYVRQDGPGSFVGGLDAITLFSGGDGAIVHLTGGYDQTGDAPSDPNSDCISRALYESEDQGEVDIVAYQTLVGQDCGNGDQCIDTDTGIGTGTDNQTQYPFVIYYMNLNTVNLTTVAATKTTHNSSAAPDWTPSNPWDASAETDTTTSNVSADVLVRGRVTGWFTNSIPSGRAADSANHLPADRWVMPDDWAELAGGALGTSFRPSYDLMFSPNSGIALSSPDGDVGGPQIGTTVAGSGTGSANGTQSVSTDDSPILIASSTDISCTPLTSPPCGAVVIGNSGPFQALYIAAVPGHAGVYALVFADVQIAAPAAGQPVYLQGTGVPFEGPYSLIDIPGLAVTNNNIAGAALSNIPGAGNSATRDTVLGDGTIDWWDAPMPPANISVSIRGAGFIKQVLKQDVYYNGTANTTNQTFPNPYYISNIPDSPYLPANVAGGNWLWDSWGPDGPAADGGLGASYGDGSLGQGPYTFWTAVLVGTNEIGVGETQSATLKQALADAQADYGDDTIARDLTIFSDNHGEFMVAANGDVNLDYSGCATNSLAGGHECKPGDAVGTGTVTAVADYPMLKKHAPIGSNAATIDWTWGGYKSVTIEKDPAGNAQFVYVVFHALDRDGHCGNADGAVLLHSALTSLDSASVSGQDAALGSQLETVDFKIDSGDGIVLSTSSGDGSEVINDTGSFATGVDTYDVVAAKAAGKVTFPLDAANAADDQTDECQAWIKVSNSLLGQTNVLTIAHDDEGNIGFDRVLDFQQTQDYTLNFVWTLFTWAGADNIPVADALAGGADTKNPQGNDITDQVTAIYGWQADTQTWLGYFPSGVDVPGANDLTSFHTGQAYWIAIKGPGNVTWTITTDVS